MKRKAILIDHNSHKSVLFFVDGGNASEILPYLFDAESVDEFKDIRGILKDNLRNKEKYCKVDVSDKAKNMFEMRFTRKGKNDRIYCQEQSVSGKRIIIMAELFVGKKSQQIPKQIKSRIETIGTYSYELDQ